MRTKPRGSNEFRGFYPDKDLSSPEVNTSATSAFSPPHATGVEIGILWTYINQRYGQSNQSKE